MQKQSIPNSFSQNDSSQRLFEAIILISSYLPYLYFRKFKYIQNLNRQRYDFPEQKVLVPRQKTKWDALISEVKEKAQIRKEIIKFKKALNYHVSHYAKDEFIKKSLKKQQRELYHRIIANQLSQNIVDYFDSFKQPIIKPTNQNFLSNNNNNIIVQSKQQQLHNSHQQKRQLDDIFIDKQQIQDDFLMMNGQGDIFDDILNVGDHVNNNNKQNHLNGINDNHNENYIKKRTIKEYVNDLVKKYQKENKQIQQNKNEDQNKIQEENDLNQQKEFVHSHISRKSCLKKINQNLRKRLKTKGAETQDRSLTSATVALSNLINNYPQCKDTSRLIQIPSSTQWIFDQSTKTKRKKDQQFKINWIQQQQDQKYTQINQTFNINSIGQLSTVTQLFTTREQYPKLFQKNISSTYSFPPNIQSIKLFSQKFNNKKFYYNEFYEEEYEKFIMKNNKKKLLEKFQKNSNFIFPEHYTQDEIENNQKISVGKMFLYPPNKISNRIIYKVQPGTTKITAIAKDYQRKNLPFSRQKIILLSFLINKYLIQFGNNWKSITEFIQIFPCFSNYLIKPQLVQELYQIVNRHQLKDSYLNNLQIWDKKILPSSEIYNQSYQNYQKLSRNLKKKSKTILEQQFDQITQQSSNPSQYTLQTQQSNLSILQNFQSLIDQPLSSQQTNKKIFNSMSLKYKQYGQKLYATTTNDTYNFYQNKVRKANKIIEQYRNTYGVAKLDTNQKSPNEERICQYIQENIKGDMKSGLPFRKKKNINQRNNQLVKILQALRSKNTGIMPQGINKPPTQMSKNPNTMQKPSQVIPPQQQQQQQIISHQQQQQIPPSYQIPPSSQQPHPNINITNPNLVIPPQTTPIPSIHPSSMSNIPLATKPSEMSQAGDKELKKSKTPQKRVGGIKKTKKKQGEEDKKQKEK